MNISKYVIHSQGENYNLLYNTKEDFLIRYSNKDFDSINELLKYDEIKKFLYEKNFFDNNERDEILERQKKSIESSNTLMLIIKLTELCNFRCVYCYEDFSNKNIDKQKSDKIIEFISNQINRSDFNKVIINWFGGEPLLNTEAIEYISPKIKRLCDKKGIEYIGSITTNGFLLNEKNFNMLLENSVVSFQITIDGYDDLHNYQRPLSNGDKTFDTIINNIKMINKKYLGKEKFSIIIRMNFSNKIFQEIDKIEGWLNELKDEENIYLDFHSIVDYSDMKHEISDLELIQIIESFLRKGFKFINLRNYLSINESLCYAAKNNHYVVDSDCRILKCTVYENDESTIGYIDESGEIKYNKYKRIWDKRYEKNKCEQCLNKAFCNGGACPLYSKKYGEPRCNKYFGLEQELLKLVEIQGNYELTLELED